MVVIEGKMLAMLQWEIHKPKDVGKYLGDGFCVHTSGFGAQLSQGMKSCVQGRLFLICLVQDS